MCVKLNNNAIETVAPLYGVLETVLIDVSMLLWLDLSFNNISSIGSAFVRLPKLKRLYLHSNAISILSEVDNLQANKELEALSLHGNPVRDSKIYLQRGNGVWGGRKPPA